MRLMALVALLLVAATPCFAQECPGQHCSAKSAVVNQMCIRQGQGGQLVYVEHAGSFCYCKCSCLAAETPVVSGSGEKVPIGAMKVGDSVLALQKDGTWKPSPVVFSDGTTKPEKPYPYAIYVALENGTSLITTADHPFLMANATLKRADRLTPDDHLLDENRKPLKIVVLTHGSYHGPIHNITATSLDVPDEPYGHLINTNGIISGDFLAQLHLTRDDDDAPQVGSDAYLSKYEDRMNASKLPKAITSGEFEFVPAQAFAIPPGAVNLIEPGDDIAAPGMLGTLDNTVPYEMGLYLAGHYQRIYPDIEVQIQWADNRVNAFAWQSGGKRFVALLGGLLRHAYIQQEGAGLVLAHEIGHHHGGPPRYPANAWASCEGQADYWGAGVVQRKAWWGKYAMEQTMAGSQQLYNLFAFGLAKGNLLTSQSSVIGPSQQVAGVCAHPPAQCRFDTYRAAMRLDPKPACAGDPGDFSLTSSEGR